MGEDGYDVVDEWTQLLTWLHAKAPATAATIRPGSSRDEIEAARLSTGLDFPEDVVAWFGLQGGVGYAFDGELLPGQVPLSLHEAVDDRARRVDVSGRAGPAPAPEASEWSDEWSPQFLPIGADGSGGAYVVDLRAGGAQGQVRQHDVEGVGLAPARWVSLGHLVSEVRRALKDREPLAAGWEARIHEGVVEWRPYHETPIPLPPAFVGWGDALGPNPRKGPFPGLIARCVRCHTHDIDLSVPWPGRCFCGALTWTSDGVLQSRRGDHGIEVLRRRDGFIDVAWG